MNRTEEMKRKAIANRIAKTIGHTKSIKSMVENGRDCSEVLMQLAAVKSAVNNAGKELMKDYIEDIVLDAVQTGDADKVKELERLIDSFMK